MRLRALSRRKIKQKSFSKFNRILKHSKASPFIFLGLIGMTSLSYLVADEGIGNYIYQLKDHSSTNSGNFYSQNTSTWSSFGKSFTQSYNNGTLILGNNTTSANSNGEHWFGTQGYVGYINATFNAKEVFLTGKIGSGNAWRTGGGATLTFNASDKITLDGADIQVYRAGSQNSNTHLGGKEVDIKNSKLMLEGGLGGGGTNRVYIGNDNTQKVTLNNTSLSFVKPAAGMVSPEVMIKTQSNDSEIKFSSITGDSGYITFDSNKGNYKTFSAQTIDINNIHIQSKDMTFHGTISGGSFKLGSESDTNFKANSIWVTNDSSIKANDIDIKNIEIQGGANWNAGTNRILTLDSSKDIKIGEFRNGDYTFGQVIGYTSTLNTRNNVTIDKIMARNFTGGNTMNVNAISSDNNTRYNINIGAIRLATAGVASSQQVINLKGKDVKISDISSLPNSVLNTVAAGELYIDNTGNLELNYLDFTDYKIVSDKFTFRGLISNGKYVNNGTQSEFTSPQVIARGNSKIVADKVTLNDVEITAGPNWNANAEVTMEVVSKNGEINLGNLKQGGYQFGQAIGYGATFKANSDINVQKVTHQNWTGGNRLTIEATDNHKIKVDSIVFTTDGVAGSEGKVFLKAKDMYVQWVTGCESWCTGNNGIRPMNTISASGENFYGGTIYAEGLVVKGSNSTLDLSGVTGTSFVDDLYLRSGTFKGQNFHLNNLTIWKSNSYTELPTNIGKSFINYLSMEIGTSGFADGSHLRLTGGGDILNFNLIDSRPTARWDIWNVKETNINQANIRNSQIWVNNANVNTIIVQTSQLGFGVFDFVKDNTVMHANALNINELLHLKKSSAYNGYMEIKFDKTTDLDVAHDFSKNLQVNVDSSSIKGMSKDELQKLIESSKAQNPNATESNYSNASGVYVTTNDGKHYLILPDIMSVDGIQNNTTQATNGGNLLIEQHEFSAKTLNNYGKILLDSSFFGKDNLGQSKDATLYVEGSLNNYNTMDIGANGVVRIKDGNFTNYGKLTFRIQADSKVSNTDSNPNAISDSIGVGMLKFEGNGTTTFDISPGSSGAFKADISDSRTLANLKVATSGQTALNDSSTYQLVNVSGGAIKYTYTQGDYTTTFDKNSISTSKNEGSCTNANCVDTGNNKNQQETYFTTNGKENPWDMDKAQSDSSGNRVENGVGENDNHGNLIHKPSQSDKKCGDGSADAYCGFGHADIQHDSNKSEAEKEADRGYDYAQERMKNSFALTYKGGSIDGKYLQVEKVVTDNVIGFRVIKKDINDFIGGDAETPLCNSESSTFDCALYMEAGGNNSWINAIKKESANSYEILKNLFYNDDSSLVFLVNLDQTLAASRNLAYFLEVGRTLDTAFKHVANLENKASTLHTLSLAMESARINRLAKIASIHGSASSWLAMQNYEKNLEFALKEAEKLRFASVDDDSVNNVWFDTLADLVMRFNQREEYPNHAWINMLGNFNFSGTGTAQLYGFNAGYDYFVDSLQTAFGLYAGYGYGTFNGNNNGFTSNTSNNIFAGIYTRTFIENHEIDVTLNSTTGLVNENQNSRINNMDLLTLFKDSYNYTLSNIDLNATYGYAFLLKKGYIVKPFAGLSYYVLHSSPFTHTSQGTIFSLDTADNTRQTLSVNIGVDGRKYFANQSYVFLVGQLKQDAIILQNNLNSQGYVSTEIGDSVTNFNMSYKAQGYRSYVFLTGGGEYSFGRWYLNGSLSVQSSVFDKNFGFGFNLGGRVVF